MRIFIWLLPIGFILFLLRFPAASSRAAVLRLLAASIDSGISPGRMLYALARESGWWERRRLTHLAECFDGGLSVSQSLDSMETYFPAEVQTELRVAEDCGQLPQAVARVAEEWSARQRQIQPHWERLFFYLAGVSLVMWSLLAFLTIYIVPKFKAIAQEFDNQSPLEDTLQASVPAGTSPPSTSETLSLMGRMGEIWSWVDFIIFLAATILVFLALPAFFRLLTGHRFGSVWGGIASRIWPQRDSPLLLRALRVPVIAGLPLTTALDVLEVHHPYHYMRKKLLQINAQVAAGDSLWELLHAHNILSARQLGLIRSAEQRGHLPWVLTQLADSLESRRADRALLLGEFLRPICVILVAIPILAIGWGVLTFLRQINHY